MISASSNQKQIMTLELVIHSNAYFPSIENLAKVLGIS